MEKLAIFVSDEELPAEVLEFADVILSDRELGIGERIQDHDERRFQEFFVEEDVSTAVALGYRRLFSGEFIERVDAELFNIHPSLLPRFKGLDVYERVMRSGVDVSGVTLHRIVEEMDEGEVIDSLEYEVPENVSPSEFRRYSRRYQEDLLLRNFKE